MQIKAALLSVLTVVSLAAPSIGFGYEFPIPDEHSNPIFQTPLSARGRFVFVNRVSRRVLKENAVGLYRPRGMRMLL